MALKVLSTFKNLTKSFNFLEKLSKLRSISENQDHIKSENEKI